MEDIKQIDFVKIVKTIRKHPKAYAISLPVAFILSCLLIICVPRYYRCTVTLAPEMSNLSSSSLSQVASSFGFDLSSATGASSDAILPELYPDLVNSVDFRTSLFPIQVVTADGTLRTDYYDYLLKHQSAPWWSVAMNCVKDIFKEKTSAAGNGKINPFRPTPPLHKTVSGDLIGQGPIKSDSIRTPKLRHPFDPFQNPTRDLLSFLRIVPPRTCPHGSPQFIFSHHTINN